MDCEQELKAFKDEYSAEVKDIIVLTSDSGGGAMRIGGSTLWTASKYILAYRNVETDKVHSDDGRIIWTLTEEEREERSWLKRFKSGCMYRLNVRELKDKTVPEGMNPSFYNRFLVVQVLEEEVADDALAAVLEEYKKPVIVTDKDLGEFKLNKDLMLLCGSVDWCNNKVSVSLDVDPSDEESWQTLLDQLRVLVVNQGTTDTEFKAFAAQELTGLANDWLSSRDDYDGAGSLTSDDFVRRIKMVELALGESGYFSAYYSDDTMFLGHVILVEGTIDKGPQSATIAG